MIRYGVLGQLEVVDGDGPVELGGRRQQLVLAVLLDHAGERVSVDRLIDAVWGEGPPPSARKTVQSYVSRLRTGGTDGAIETVGDGYRLDVDGELDAAVFERLATEGRQLLDTDPVAAGRVLREALGLWRGVPYGSLGDEPALRPSRQQLLERRLEVTETRMEADLATGRHDGLVAELRALIADHPLREPLHALLMRALYLQGRQADALEVARQLRARVADELGLEPSPAIDVLQRRILDHDPTLRSAAALSATAGAAEAADTGDVADADGDVARENPYRGLRAFGEGEAALFFGRDELVDDLVAEVAERSLVLVVGPSGSGKSSVVRAGLLPALRRRNPGWTVATIVPGAHPFAEFEAALVRAAPDVAPVLSDQLRGDDLDLLRVALTVVPDDGHVLLVVDQLEELFLLPAPEERDRFVRGLVELVDDPHDRVTVVATVRADFLNRPLQDPTLGPYVEPTPVPPMEPAQLEAACVGPARTVGVGVAPELVTQLVADVASEPGALPLFQYTLTQLFEARDGGPLTLAGYRAHGGLRGSLVRRADELLAELDDEGRAAARQVFLRLVTIGEGTEDTRRRTRRAELAAMSIPAATLGEVLTTFGTARLLSFDRDAATGGGTVEVAHESLLREWPTLRRWIDEARDDLRLRHQLTSAAREWEAAGHDDDFLLAGSRIAQVEERLSERSLDLTALESDFVAASRTHQDAVEAAEQQRKEHEAALEARAQRRLRQLVAVFAVAAVIASALGIVAVNRADEIASSERRRFAQALSGDVAAIGAEDPQLGLLLALEAVRVAAAEGPVAGEVVAGVHWALQAAAVPYPDDLPVRVVDSKLGPRGIYELEVDELVAHARAHVTRDLTGGECRDHLAVETCPDPLPSDFGAQVVGAQPAPSTDATGLAGTTVRMAAPPLWWDPAENPAVTAMINAITRGIGVQTQLDTSQERPEDLAATRPDILIVHPEDLRRMAAFHPDPLDVTGWVDVADIPPTMRSVASVDDDGSWPGEDGQLVGVPVDIRAHHLVWYSKAAFDEGGYEPPTTYEELIRLADRMVADGRTPWCLGLGDGGWAGGDIIESLVLADQGVAGLDALAAGELRFQDPVVRRAFDRFAELYLRPGMVAGGVEGAPSRLMWHEMFAPVAPTPTNDCMMAVGLTATGEDGGGGDDAGWFTFPPVTSAGEGAMYGIADVVVPLTDRPEVRATVATLTGHGPAIAALNAGGWGVPPRTSFNPTTGVLVDAYGGRLALEVHTAMASGSLAYDASVRMPPEVRAAFGAGMQDIARDGPDAIDGVLAELDAIWDAESRFED